MNFESFTESLASVFNDAVLKRDTKFRDLDGWSSLTGLWLIALIDEDFGVLLNAADVRSVNTIGELFDLVKSRKL